MSESSSGPRPRRGPPDDLSVLARAMERGWLGAEEVDRCLAQPLSIGIVEHLVREGRLDPERVEEIRKSQGPVPARRFGDLAVSKGFLTPEQLEIALADQRRLPVPSELGRILLAKGWLDWEQMAAILRDQGMPSTDLAGVVAAQEEEDAPQPLAPGGVVGRFEIVREIGRGGMGVVYEARDTHLERRVALKVLSSEFATEQEVRRLRREASLAARLRHPGIVTVHEVGVADGVHYIAMELVEGQDLAVRLGREGALAPREAAALLEKVARAVHHAHEQGIVHRDLKPGNILLGPGGRPVVSDFGLSRSLEESVVLTASGAVIGTPAYMSPEQLLGQRDRVGVASDIWALGVVLYEAISGRRPFEGDSSAKVFKAILELEPPRLGRGARLVPLETIALACLAKSPAERYATALDLAEDLARFRKGARIRARRAPLALRLWRRFARRPALAASALLAATALVAAAAIVKFERKRAGEEVQDAGEARREVEASLLAELRSSSARSVEAALLHRRLGEIDEMREELARLEGAVSRVRELAPDLAEPFYHEGRRFRIEERNGEALAAQEEALRRDPGLAGARYERIILSFSAWSAGLRKERERRRDEWATDSTSGAWREPSLAELEDSAPDLREIGRGILSDVEALEEGPGSGPWAKRALGLAAILSGRDEEGRRILEAEAVSGDASDEIHTALGALALGRGETDEAVRCWRRAVEADRGFFAHRLGLARALRIRSEGRSEKGGDAEADLDEADRILAAGLALDSGRAGMWTELALVDWNWARARSAAGRDAADALSNALAAADRALALAPQDLEAANVRGAVFLELGKLQEAIEAFGGVLAADPGHFQAHNNRALARLRAGDALQAAGGDPREEYLAAIRGFEEAIALRPRFTWAHGNLGWTWKRMGNHEHLLGLDPNGSYDNASRSLSTALDLSPRSAGIWNNLAAVHLSTGDYRMEKGGDAAASFREALDALDQSLAANPGYYLALGNKGYAWMRLGEVDLGAGGDPEEEFGRAIRSFEASLAANPAHEEGRRLLDGLRVERGLSRLRAGRPAEAIAELDAALESIGRFGELDDPDFRAFRGEIHLALARAHARLAAAAGAEAKRERDLAFESLARALADGAVDSARARRDPDLAALSSDPRWEAALGGR